MKIKADQTIKSRIEEINNKIEDRTTFFYYAFRNILLVSLPLVVVSGFVLSLSHSSATDNSSGSGSTDSFTVSISSACTISGVVNSIHNIETNVGTYVADVGKTTIKTLCNDGNGYAIYANGYSNNEEGNNKLINSGYPQYSIDTGLATSGLTSAWAMKLNNIENDPSPTPPVIESNYNDTYGLVPTIWTKVAGRTAGTTDMDEGSSFTTTYSVYASSNQHAGTYLGQVKYALLHPSTEPYYPFMQDVANWGNIRLPNIGDSIQAIDQRDGKKYWVTKLKDGHIWMTQNLDFDIVAGATVITSNNTDLSTDENIYMNNNTIYALKGANDNYGYTYENGIATWIPERTTIAYNQLNSTTWQSSNTDPYSYDRLDISTGEPVYPDSNITQSIAGNHGLSGNYYNWTAAVASNDSSNTYSIPNNNPVNSICPKGWRLPNNINIEFGNLLVDYNIISTSTSNSYLTNMSPMSIAPLYFVRSGGIDRSSLVNSGVSGTYWYSTFSDNSNSYSLYFTNSMIHPQDNWGRNYGRNIRCIAR